MGWNLTSTHKKKVHKLQRDGHTAITQLANSKLFDILQYWKVFPSRSGKSNKCTSVTFTWQYHPLWGCMQCLLPTSQEETKCLNCNFVRQYFTFIRNIWRTWCRANITSTTSWPELTFQAIIATLRKIKRLWKKIFQSRRKKWSESFVIFLWIFVYYVMCHKFFASQNKSYPTPPIFYFPPSRVDY